jgi:hypothetical protein
MQPKLIYLDTNLWNTLCDQCVSPAGVVDVLRVKNAWLTLGNEAVYEMAKTFRDSGDAGRARGMTLFSYMYQYLSEQIPLVRVNMELIAAEIRALRRGLFIPETLLNSADYETTRGEIESLSRGEVSQRVKEHIEARVASAEAIRFEQTAHLKDWPDIKRQLTDVSSEQLSQWLDEVLRSQAARGHLAGQIKNHFPEAKDRDTIKWAEVLLGSPVGRVSKAVVRRMFYYNWRCAHRGSVSKDVYFDTNHILNSNYADVYATKEPKQTEYAGMLLTPATKIAIYDGSEGVEQWLTRLADDIA